MGIPLEVQRMPQRVNLDSLIRRENFEVVSGPPSSRGDEDPKLKIGELEAASLFFRYLRKPDFQRRTAHWTPDKIAGLVKSFVDGDLIPALILWPAESSASIFVIDGAHRLSALLAWVHDDYGDGTITQRASGHIVEEQKGAAKETRRLVNQLIGSYADLTHGAHNTPERIKHALNLAKNGVTLQWVKGNAQSAERSFHTINTEQSPIGELEKRLIRDRRCPNAIATRALINAGTGLNLSSFFPEANKLRIQQLAKSIYEDLFTPRLEEPIKTLDLPVAGSSYSDETVRLVLDVVEFVNKPKETDTPKKRAPRGSKTDLLVPTMDEDSDGTATIQFLTSFGKTSFRVAGMSAGSLGLHPAVYFYSATGKYQPTAFLAAVSLIRTLVDQNELNEFSIARFRFEELLVDYKVLINEIVRHYGSGSRGLSALTRLQRHMLDGVWDGKAGKEIIPGVVADKQLAFLASIIDPDKGTKKEFTKDKKSAAFLVKALDSAVRCRICKARLHKKSITTDHIKDLKDDGPGTEDNAQPTHPYCNSTFKDWMRATGRQLIL